MGFMNFFKNQDDREDIKEENDEPVGGFANWEEALKSMKNAEINKHKENISHLVEILIKNNKDSDFNICKLDKILDEKALYFEENKEFLNEFKEILKSGGSVRPKELLLKYGVDISKEEFYKNGLELIKEKVERFKKINIFTQ